MPWVANSHLQSLEDVDDRMPEALSSPWRLQTNVPCLGAQHNWRQRQSRGASYSSVANDTVEHCHRHFRAAIWLAYLPCFQSEVHGESLPSPDVKRRSAAVE